MTEYSNQTRAAILSAALNLPTDESKELYELYADDTASANGGEVFECNGGEYLVLTDEEAGDHVTEYIKESLWAFNPSFLAGQTDLPVEIFEALQANDQCESNNPALLRLIEECGDLSDFVNAAVSADGRGHFMSSYDGEEIEHGEFFIYRIN